MDRTVDWVGDDSIYRDPKIKTFAYWHAATIRERWCGRAVTPGRVEEDEIMSGTSDKENDVGMSVVYSPLKRRRTENGQGKKHGTRGDKCKRYGLQDGELRLAGDLFG